MKIFPHQLSLQEIFSLQTHKLLSFSTSMKNTAEYALLQLSVTVWKSIDLNPCLDNQFTLDRTLKNIGIEFEKDLVH